MKRLCRTGRYVPIVPSRPNSAAVNTVYLTVDAVLQSRTGWQVTFQGECSISQESPFLLPPPPVLEGWAFSFFFILTRGERMFIDFRER